ncbi:thioredoxin-like protein [Xylogone sp. PMI_703]|nr:thioredoxin-like protein [Xylogone sp. PMI_703]
MSAPTAAQEEFASILAKNSGPGAGGGAHPADRDDYRHDEETSDRDEDDEYRDAQIEATLNMPMSEKRSLRLPPRDFDSGRTTGVKGVIADARAYEEARRNKFARETGGRGSSRSAGPKGNGGKRMSTFFRDKGEGSDSEGDEENRIMLGDDDEEFMERWRQARRLEMEKEGNDIRNRRSSPSVRKYGRFDEVDALGYLDAIEKVGRATVVVVFVYDHECEVSQVIHDALAPLVSQHPLVHFVKVHYEEIDFDNAGVPAILAYKNQGDLFANLTYVIDQIPEDEVFDTTAMENILRKRQIL